MLARVDAGEGAQVLAEALAGVRGVGRELGAIVADVPGAASTARDLTDGGSASGRWRDSTPGPHGGLTAVGARSEAGAASSPSTARTASSATATPAGAPLRGVPILVKDFIDIAGMPTLLGSAATDPTPRPADAAVVAALRAAGAVPVAKTVTHEFAFGPTGDVTATGPVHNPHDSERMAGGSSAGSAAGLRAGIAPSALGTDTGGSGRVPAAWCGVVGMRPTHGVLSLEGVWPLSPSLDTVSPMGVDVDAVLRVWEALRADAGCPGTGRELGAHEPHAGCPGEPVRPLTVGIISGGWWQQVVPAVTAALDRTADILTDLGHTLRPTPGEWADELHLVYRQVQGPEAIAANRDTLEHRPERIHPEVLERFRHAAAITPAAHADAVARMHALRANPEPAFDGTDVLLCATSPVAAPRIGQRDGFDAGWHTTFDVGLRFTSPFSVLGVPALSLPAGAERQPGGSILPVGVQLVARHGREAQLLALAATLEARLTRVC